MLAATVTPPHSERCSSQEAERRKVSERHSTHVDGLLALVSVGVQVARQASMSGSIRAVRVSSQESLEGTPHPPSTCSQKDWTDSLTRAGRLTPQNHMIACLCGLQRSWDAFLGPASRIAQPCVLRGCDKLQRLRGDCLVVTMDIAPDAVQHIQITAFPRFVNRCRI